MESEGELIDMKISDNFAIINPRKLSDASHSNKIDKYPYRAELAKRYTERFKPRTLYLNKEASQPYRSHTTSRRRSLRKHVSWSEDEIEALNLKTVLTRSTLDEVRQRM